MHLFHVIRKQSQVVTYCIMNISRPVDMFKDCLYQLFGRIVNEPESVHIYRKTIRIAQPYIRFVFLDTDSMPTAKNIRLSRSYSNPLFRHRKLLQPEPHVLHESLYSHSRREKPVSRSFTLDAPTNVIDKSIPSAEQPVSIVAALNPDAQREKPVFRSFTLDAPIGAHRQVHCAGGASRVRRGRDRSGCPARKAGLPVIHARRPDRRHRQIHCAGGAARVRRSRVRSGCPARKAGRPVIHARHPDRRHRQIHCVGGATCVFRRKL